jgi:O-antigen/teichoic acid export membrane protein
VTQTFARPEVAGAESAASEARNDSLLATRNALKLAGSLLGTWGIAMGMRFLLPRFLGPERFGALSFADAFASTFFVALGLGVDLYVRKRVSVDTRHASDFFGGTFALRALMSLGVVLAMALAMRALGRPIEVRRVVYVFALAQFFVTTNATLSAMLQAKGAVGGMSVLAVATKIVWAGGVLLAIAAGAGLWSFALAYLVSEGVESVVLFGLAARHMGLVFRIDVPATKVVLVFSLPYYLNTFATTAYGKLDVSVLAFLGNSVEVGFYSAAGAIAGLSLLMMPLIGWVLMPTLARAAARSHEELFLRIRSSSELILSVTIPVALFASLGADIGVRLLFGDAFAPATLALRILAPTFVVTYLAIVYAITLLMLDRAWTLTGISIGGLCINVALNLALVRPAMKLCGPGGGGAGCALSMLGTEVFVTAAMAVAVGRRAVGGKTLRMIAKSAGACALVIVVDRLLVALGPGRLVVDAALYLVLAVSTRALRLSDVSTALREALRGPTAGSGARTGPHPAGGAA